MYHIKRPRYWQLYLLVVIGIGLMILVQFWNISETTRTAIHVGIVWTGYGVFNIWLAVNSSAVEREKEARQDAAAGKAPAINEQQTHYRRTIRSRLHHDR